MSIDLSTKKREFIDVLYKQVGVEKLYLDLYFPTQIVDNMSVFVYVHGGGFLWYDKSIVDETFRINHTSYKNRLLEHNFLFVSVEYRRDKVDEYSCVEAQIEDVKDAIKWIKKHADALHCNPNNIGLWGLSAGGALALGAAYNSDSLYTHTIYPHISSSVSYVIDFYGITDIYSYYNLRSFTDKSDEDKETTLDLIYRHTNIRVTNEQYYKNVKDIADTHSPLYHVQPNNIQVSIYHGTADLQVGYEENALAFYEKNIQHGNSIVLYPYEGKGHGFWWDTPEFYQQLENQVIEDVLIYASMSHKDI